MMVSSHKSAFVNKRWGSQYVWAEAWAMIFNRLWTAASLLLILVIVFLPKLAVAGIQKMDEDDPRIEESRGEKFVNERRTVRGDRTIVAVKAPVGYWSQAIYDCKNKDRPIQIQYTGAVILRLPGWKTYYLMGDNVPGTVSTESLASELEDERWEVTGLTDGSFVTLECPRRDDVLSTLYEGIDNTTEDGLIHQPKCQINDEEELCYVLGINLKSELAKEGWATGHSVGEHSKLVDAYNQHVRKYGQQGHSIQNRMRFANVNAMLWYISYSIVIGMCFFVIRNWR